MFFKHIYEPGLAHASYIVGCQATGEALVIDPRRDIDVYLDTADKENLRITHIAETHIHADFLSGSRELANVTGADVYLSDEGGAEWQYQFDHKGLRDGDSFMVGNLKIEVLHTPGHTPEHISFLLTDTPASTEPIMVFTGDFVFVGDIGRPDLLEKAAGLDGTMEAGARQLFHSIQRFKQLPDHLQIWPAHGAGSACGKALGAVPSSTVGYEKLVNWGLNIDNEDKFVETVLDGQPEPPKYFAMMKKLNKEGAQILGGIPRPARLSVSQFRKVVEDDMIVIDTRTKLAFSGGHLHGSINIQDNKAFSTWAGWILNYEEPFVLVASDSRIEELTKSLIRIGLDNLAGYVASVDHLSENGFETEVLNQISLTDLRNNLDDFQVIDVRGKTEYDAGHIPGAANIPAGYIGDRLDEIPRDKQVVVHCASGDRSAIAGSLLLSHGFTNVINLTQGFSGWDQARYPVVKSNGETVHTEEQVSTPEFSI